MDSENQENKEPDLTGRKAKCAYSPSGGKYGKCPEPVDSKKDLAFFEHQPDKEFDKYYCGCWGWD